MDKFNSTPKDEQETIVYIDYFDKTITLYSTKEHILKSLTKVFGKPYKIDYFNGMISSFEYKVSFDDSKLKSILSINTLVGSHNRRKKLT